MSGDKHNEGAEGTSLRRGRKKMYPAETQSDGPGRKKKPSKRLIETENSPKSSNLPKELVDVTPQGKIVDPDGVRGLGAGGNPEKSLKNGRAVSVWRLFLRRSRNQSRKPSLDKTPPDETTRERSSGVTDSSLLEKNLNEAQQAIKKSRQKKSTKEASAPVDPEPEEIPEPLTSPSSKRKGFVGFLCSFLSTLNPKGITLDPTSEELDGKGNELDETSPDLENPSEVDSETSEEESMASEEVLDEAKEKDLIQGASQESEDSSEGDEPATDSDSPHLGEPAPEKRRRTKKTKRKIDGQKLAAAGLRVMVLAGVGLIGYAIGSISNEDQEQAEVQQAQAETVPLVVPAQSTDGTESDSPFSDGQIFAKLYIPRFGDTYVREVAEGTGLDAVLNTVGIGRYTSSQMPGEEGNFALAGHRTGNGGPFRDIDKFQAGDLVFVETATAWYTYQYLETAVIDPTQTEVIAKVPGVLSSARSGGKYLTLTSCTPIYINTERIAAWFELVEEQPASEGMPLKLLEIRG